MIRREFITLLGSAAIGRPLLARAEQGDRVRRIGILSSFAESDSEPHAWVAPFLQGLQALGWTEGRMGGSTTLGRRRRPDRVRGCFRPGRQRICRKPAAAGRQHHRFIDIESSLGSKWLALLKEIAPRVARVALMFNPKTAPYSAFYLRPFEAAAPLFAMTAVAAPVQDRALRLLGIDGRHLG
jgi:putative ABC transport system substrate-binding protein